MRIRKNDRGFKYAPFKDLYGSDCSIQESSLATDNAIWFGVDVAGPGYKTVMVGVRMHLNQKQVKKLLPVLEFFVKTGRLK